MNLIKRIIDIFVGNEVKTLRTLAGSGIGIALAKGLFGKPDEPICFTVVAAGFILLLIYIVLESAFKKRRQEED